MNPNAIAVFTDRGSFRYCLRVRKFHVPVYTGKNASQLIFSGRGGEKMPVNELHTNSEEVSILKLLAVGHIGNKRLRTFMEYSNNNQQ